jgi:pimeloyl-ACP methyl ester carboxylesterase
MRLVASNHISVPLIPQLAAQRQHLEPNFGSSFSLRPWGAAPSAECSSAGSARNLMPSKRTFCPPALANMSICCFPTYFQPEGAKHTLCATRCALTAAAPNVLPGAPPVILCHGLGSNRHTYLLPAQRNIVHMLLEGGWDVWLAELRGHGQSKAGVDWERPWDVDDYISDARSFAAFVSDQASGALVHWIGHSLGGIVGIAMASLQQPPPLASIIAVASSFFYSDSVFRKLSFLLPAITSLSFLPADSIMRAQSHLSFRFVSNYCDSVMAWRSNVHPDVGRSLLASNFEPISKKVTLQLATGMAEAGILHREGEPFSSGLINCRIPMLLIAGDQDKQCPPHSVRRLFELLPRSAACTYQCFGKDQGCLDHYGHFDLLIGLRVEHEVFPSMRAFLQSH